MEKQLEEDIRKFLSISYGYGYGSGDGSGYGSDYGDGYGDGYGSGDGYGYGYGDSYGDGYGYGSGDGSGDGYGYGYGSGSGDGSGISEFNGQKVWNIDGVQTIIDSVHDTYAKGSILSRDFTLTPCFIVKAGNCFAHGETLRKAFNDAMAKALKKMPLDERISMFKEQFPDPGVKIHASQLYEWHNTLTGSCEMGRKRFARDHGIDIDTDSLTVREFITLTKDSYGSDAIKELAKAYNLC